MDKDLYKILDINKNASNRDIKKAYRDLVIKWHPDKNHNNIEEATAKFKDISDAYQILIDPNKRKKYDRYLYQANQQNTNKQHNTQYNTQHNTQYNTQYNTQNNTPQYSYSYDAFYSQYAYNLRDPYEVFRDVMTAIDSISSTFNIIDQLFSSNMNYLNKIDLTPCKTFSFFQNNNDEITWMINIYPNGSERGIITDTDIERLVEYSYQNRNT